MYASVLRIDRDRELIGIEISDIHEAQVMIIADVVGGRWGGRSTVWQWQTCSVAASQWHASGTKANCSGHCVLRRRRNVEGSVASQTQLQ